MRTLMESAGRLAWLGLLATGALTLSGCPAVSAGGEKKTSRIADEAKPGTVLLQTSYEATVSVPSVQLNQQAIMQLAQQVQAAVNSGQIPNDQSVILDVILKEMLGNLSTYASPSTPWRDVDAKIDAVGSGFFVTPDGYVVTNAHVVSENERDLKVALAEKALQQLIEQDVKDFQAELGGQATDEHLDLLRKAAVDFYVQYMQLGEVQSATVVHVGAGVPGVAVVTKPMAAEVLKNALGEPIPGKDVAILKISGDNFPTLEIGDDRDLKVGDRIYPYGYPADATFFAAFDASSITEPSLTTGLVSSEKQMQGGWKVIQTDAAIRGGNSGGPVFDSKGKVIGIATFTLRDPETGAGAVGANFVVPISVVKEFLQRANVTPKTSPAAKLYVEALDLMDREAYKTAVEKLKEVDSLKPGMPAIQKQIEYCHKMIADGRDKSGPPMTLILAIVGAAIVLIGVVVLLAKAKGRPPLPPSGHQPPQVPPPGETPTLPGG